MNVPGRLIIILLVGVLFLTCAFSVDITNVWLGNSPTNYTVVISKVGSEISINNEGLVIYISSATDNNLCFNIVSSKETSSLETMCVQKGHYVRVSGFLIYYLGNNSSNLGIFISNGLLPSIYLNMGSGPFFINKNIQIEVTPILGPKANISLTVVGNDGKVITYPYFTEDNCQGYNCKMVINFKPVSIGEYKIKVSDCYKGFCIYNSTTINVISEKSNKEKSGKIIYSCKTYYLETGHTYKLYNGKLLMFINHIIKYKYSGAMIVNFYVTTNAGTQLFNLKVNSGNVSVGEFNISVLNLENLTRKTPPNLDTPYIIYSGTVKMLICKKKGNSLTNIYININNKNPSVGSTIKISAGISYIENIMAKLEIQTPDGNIIDLGTCINSHCNFEVSYKIPEKGKYVIILHYCIPSGCYDEKAPFYVGIHQQNNNVNNNVIKIQKTGIYTIPTNTTVIIYTRNKIYKLFFGYIQKKVGYASYFTTIYYGKSMHSSYKNVVVFNDKNLWLKILDLEPTTLKYSKCVTPENCYTYYKGKIKIYVNISKNVKVLVLNPGINVIYPDVAKTVPLSYFMKYCGNNILELYQLTPDGWVSSKMINLDTVLYIFVGVTQCSVPIPSSPKGKGIKNLDLLYKTLYGKYNGYETGNQISIKLE